MKQNDLLPLTIRTIQERVSEYFDIQISEMRSLRRNRSIARPRQVAMHLACRLTEHSLPVIGNCFNRDHTTVRHADIHIPSLMAQDLKLDESVRFLKEELADINAMSEELSVQLAIDQLVNSVTAKLRGKLVRLANTDPIALIETLKEVDTPKRRLDS